MQLSSASSSLSATETWPKSVTGRRWEAADAVGVVGGEEAEAAQGGAGGVAVAEVAPAEAELPRHQRNVAIHKTLCRLLT